MWHTLIPAICVLTFDFWFVSGVLSVALSSIIHAQPTFRLLKSSQRTFRIGTQTTVAGAARSIGFLGRLLAMLSVNEPTRQDLESKVMQELRKATISDSAIRSLFTAAGVAPAQAGFVTDALLGFMTTSDSRGPSSILSAVTAAATNDRLYSTVELYSFTGNHFSYARVL